LHIWLFDKDTVKFVISGRLSTDGNYYTVVYGVMQIKFNVRINCNFGNKLFSWISIEPYHKERMLESQNAPLNNLTLKISKNWDRSSCLHVLIITQNMYLQQISVFHSATPIEKSFFVLSCWILQLLDHIATNRWLQKVGLFIGKKNPVVLPSSGKIWFGWSIFF